MICESREGYGTGFCPSKFTLELSHQATPGCEDDIQRLVPLPIQRIAIRRM